ncbi:MULTISPECIES: hypothetical protein [unclassified Paenibacillus]|nr:MULTISPECIES: hypothetical protein [unclassified Paenibacillus]MBU5442578.1 hypothetical protein [Paenibacillus sp. MSJ-34]CAH0119032.1 hypothetical protein PAE9249_01529 [Paenibacillus sp. CECT 9249]
MPNNKAEKKNNLQNKSRLKEEAITLQADKAADYPPSLNNINKREQ